VLLIGFLISLLIGYGAEKHGALTTAGAAWAVVLGTIVFGLGGGVPGLCLIAFFLTCTALGRYRKSEKSQRTEGIVEKGDCRDATQVLANGGPAAVFCLLYAATGQSLFYVGALAALAAATADTWATEIGLLSPTAPRDVLTWREVTPGTSGAVSVAGLVGTVAGAAFIAFLTLGEPTNGTLLRALFITMGGTAGGILDSILGATVQEQRTCLSCNAKTEQQRHNCGGQTVRSAGVAGLDNDAVNALAGALGGTLAALAWWLVGGVESELGPIR
jgi:uncharacterized protein (TIGR00297 family)